MHEGPRGCTKVHEGPHRSTQVHEGPRRCPEGPRRSTKVHEGAPKVHAGRRRSTQVHDCRPIIGFLVGMPPLCFSSETPKTAPNSLSSQRFPCLGLQDTQSQWAAQPKAGRQKGAVMGLLCSRITTVVRLCSAACVGALVLLTHSCV